VRGDRELQVAYCGGPSGSGQVDYILYREEQGKKEAEGFGLIKENQVTKRRQDNG